MTSPSHAIQKESDINELEYVGLSFFFSLGVGELGGGVVICSPAITFTVYIEETVVHSRRIRGGLLVVRELNPGKLIIREVLYSDSDILHFMTLPIFKAVPSLMYVPSYI